MCGLAGILAPPGASGAAIGVEVQRLTDTLHHRGPDDGGTWTDASAGIALGHRRLSVVDLSIEGHQPMVSADGRYVAVYNGEIYNHLALRTELGPQPWRGHSDTETFLAAVMRWGVEGALRRCAGMFAIALWDRERRQLHLARDRMGEKPLYYGWVGRHFVFGSELKAIARHSAFSAGVDRESLARLLARGYIDGGRSIYQGIESLTPGALLTLSHEKPAPAITRFWDLATVASAPRNRSLSPAAAVDELESRLGAIVGEQVVADVPVGAFLSGGIDSSTVVALMRAHSRHAVRTFTVGFESPRFDESAHARAMAAHLGTQHTELRVGDAEVRAAIPTVCETFDEPFGDSSAIPTWLVSRLARQHVTVALSGDGGDELFCGYTRYLNLRRHWARVTRVPRTLRRLGGALAAPLARRGVNLAQLAQAASGDVGRFYEFMTRKWRAPRRVVLGLDAAPRAAHVGFAPADPMEAAMYDDMLGYLPGDILTKVDRAGMRCSLESRIPMLDHRLVEWAWTLPVDLKLRGGEGKWLLRQVLGRHAPASLFERPKMGFGVPLDEWLRGSLREWADDLLAEGTLRRQGYLDAAAIRDAWRRHQAGENLRDTLWPVLMFQSWLGRRS